MTAPLVLVATCVPGLEPMLLAEVQALGGLAPEVFPGGVSFRGHRRVIHRAHLELGLASHLRILVTTLEATRFDELVRKVSSVPWEIPLPAGSGRHVRATTRRCRLHHTQAIEERVTAAIRGRLRDDPPPPDVLSPTVFVHGERDRFVLSIDTSGPPLHRRGYRITTTAAPLREDLARALVVASGWDRRSPLIDFFAGSGTIGIEAAMLAGDFAPGRARQFALERTGYFHEPTWQEVRREADARAQRQLPAPILLSDRADQAVEAMRTNAAAAGVFDQLSIAHSTVTERDLTDVSRHPSGAIVTNPPHGRRLNPHDSLDHLYQALGRRVSQLPGYQVCVLTAHQRPARQAVPNLRTAFITQSGGKTVRALVTSPEPLAAAGSCAQEPSASP